MRLMTVKPPSRRSSVPATLGSTVASGSGVVSSSSTRSRSSRKPLHRVVAGEHVGAGGELDEFLLPRAAAVHHVRQAQALADAQLLGQVQHRLGGRLAAEELVGDAAEREHIQARAVRGVGAGRLRREVDHPRVFDVVLDVLGAGRAVHGVWRCGVTDVARRGLPVHQAQVQRTAADAMDEDALRPQGAVVEALGVGVLQRLGDVAHQLQALRDREVLAVVAQQVIQAHGLGVVIEDQRRAELGLLVVLDLQDARVVDAFEDLELAARLAHARGADLGAGGGSDGVDADTAMHRVDADVLGFPVLKAFAFGQQLAEPVVAHLAVLVGGTDAGLGEAASDGASLLRVDGRRERLVMPLASAPTMPGSSRVPGRPRWKVAVFASPSSLQDRLVDERKIAGSTKGRRILALVIAGCRFSRLARRLALRFARMTGLSTVVGSAIGRPGPAVHVAGQHARAALDLDEEEAGRREHQGIDLADLALVVDELEVGPDVPGIAVGQLASKPVQRLSLPREVGLGDDMPAGGAEGHGFTSRSSGTYSNRSPTWQLKSRQSWSTAGRSTRVVVSL